MWEKVGRQIWGIGWSSQQSRGGIWMREPYFEWYRVKIWAEGSVGDALRCLASGERHVACDNLNFPISSHIYYFHLSVMWRFIIWMLVEAWPLCAFSSKNISCSFDLNCFGSKDMRSGMQPAYGNMKNSQRWEISRRSNWGDMDWYMVFLFHCRL